MCACAPSGADDAPLEQGDAIGCPVHTPGTTPTTGGRVCSAWAGGTGSDLRACRRSRLESGRKPRELTRPSKSNVRDMTDEQLLEIILAGRAQAAPELPAPGTAEKIVDEVG